MLSRKTISLLLKIGIVAFSIFFLYEQLTVKSSVAQFNTDMLLEQIKARYGVLIVITLMMFLNWFLEALKWRFLISKIEKISISRSFRAIFSGITVSAFTPNRVGEYGGRVFCLEKSDRLQAVLVTVIGSIGQLVTTIFFGSIGLLFLPKYSLEFYRTINSIDFGYPILVFSLALLNMLIVFLFLNSPLLSIILSRIRFLSKYKKYNEVFAFYNTSELAKVLWYSVARYVVFTTQFFILLNLFGVDIVYIDAIVLIMIMLFVVSIIPTIAITEIGVRGSVAISLFSLISINTTSIFLATFVLWVINLVLPALIGTVFIFTLKFFRE